MKKKIDKIIDKSLRFHHRDIHKEFTEMKLRAQVKSKWYYIFWGIATVSVFLGQLYVGSIFRIISKIRNKLIQFCTCSTLTARVA